MRKFLVFGTSFHVGKLQRCLLKLKASELFASTLSPAAAHQSPFPQQARGPGPGLEVLIKAFPIALTPTCRLLRQQDEEGYPPGSLPSRDLFSEEVISHTVCSEDETGLVSAKMLKTQNFRYFSANKSHLPAS